MTALEKLEMMRRYHTLCEILSDYTLHLEAITRQQYETERELLRQALRMEGVNVR